MVEEHLRTHSSRPQRMTTRDTDRSSEAAPRSSEAWRAGDDKYRILLGRCHGRCVCSIFQHFTTFYRRTVYNICYYLTNIMWRGPRPLTSRLRPDCSLPTALVSDARTARVVVEDNRHRHRHRHVQTALPSCRAPVFSQRPAGACKCSPRRKYCPRRPEGHCAGRCMQVLTTAPSRPTTVRRSLRPAGAASRSTRAPSRA